MIVLLLSSCATANFNYDVKEYTKEQLNKAADEMESKACPMLNTFMGDYSILMEQSR